MIKIPDQQEINRRRLEVTKNKFVRIFKDNIKREGSEKLLSWLQSSDFFIAPASAKYHNAFEGGLVEHSINVYESLKGWFARPDLKMEIPSDETIALISLMHDLCKVGVYKTSYRNAKNEVTGQWEKVPFYQFEDDVPYGHGEKSVYMLSGFVRISREEAMAIRWHMGFSEEGKIREVGNVFEKFPLAMALNVADMEATFTYESR